MKNNLLKSIMVLLLVVASVVGLLYAINDIVTVALSPIKGQIGEIRALIKHVETKSPSTGAAVSDASLSTQINSLNQRLTVLDSRINQLLTLIQRGPAQQRPQMPQEDMNKQYTIEIGNSPVLGDKNAPITIVEFIDIQCPFCLRFYPVVKDVIKAYPGKVRSVVKNFPLPFHPNALPAAKLALAANEQGKYYEMLDLLLTNAGDVSEDKVKGYAKELKINYKKLMDDYKNKDAQWQKIVDADKELGSKVEVRGTPTFYLNGKKTNARDVDSFKAEIEKILANKK